NYIGTRVGIHPNCHKVILCWVILYCVALLPSGIVLFMLLPAIIKTMNFTAGVRQWKRKSVLLAAAIWEKPFSAV
ncbi:TPA: hypothetical protein ACULBV_002057, partial [Escherichia coli]